MNFKLFTNNSQQLEAGNVVVVKKGAAVSDEYTLVTSQYDHLGGQETEKFYLCKS